MSLHISSVGHSHRTVLLAVAAAIKRIEKIANANEQYEIGNNEAELLCSAIGDLWAILETNGYSIDSATNKLRRVKK